MRNDKQRLLGCVRACLEMHIFEPPLIFFCHRATNMLVGAHVTANAALDTGRDTLAELGRQRERMEQSRLSVR